MNQYRLVDPSGNTLTVDGRYSTPPTLKGYMRRRGWKVERLLESSGRWVPTSSDALPGGDS